jgi:hypothetical protein
MAINKLYISTDSYNWSNHPGVDTMTLVDSGNLSRLLEITEVVDGYTTIADITDALLPQLCRAVNEVQLVDITYTFLAKNNEFDYFRLLNILNSTKNSPQVENIDKLINNDLNFLQNARTTDAGVLWSVGCSITAGSGVDKDKKYTTLVAERLGLTEILLATPGSSINWAADQILRSDIRPGDIVVWGLTSTSRIDIAQNFNLKSIMLNSYKHIDKSNQFWSIDYFSSRTQIVICLKQILQVINYCNKIGVKIYLVNLLDRTLYNIMLGNKENYIDMSPEFNVKLGKMDYIDFGTDNNHPGPKQHQQYAEVIFNLIKENHYG